HLNINIGVESKKFARKHMNEKLDLRDDLYDSIMNSEEDYAFEKFLNTSKNLLIDDFDNAFELSKGKDIYTFKKRRETETKNRTFIILVKEKE
ncbi:MAG: hypothetical protein ACTSRL_22905, partial [Candidatus Helarchaeota archaeon]